MDTLRFFPASQHHIPDIVEIVNLAYRGQGENRGWTTEADLIVGNRINEQQLQQILSESHSHIITAWQAQQLAACVHLQQQGEAVFLGMLSVHPRMQAKGIGKALMQYAEQFAQTELYAKRMEMCVISRRAELIDYYHRRGYVLANRQGDFPLEANAGVPVCGDLKIEYLYKEFL